MDVVKTEFDRVMSRLNLLAVLKALEELVRLDEECKQLIADTDLTLRFSVKSGPGCYLTFNRGTIKVMEGVPEHCHLHLFFLSPGHLNKMIDGKAPPIPVKGLHRLSFLTGTFSKLADRLAYYLKADEALLADPAVFDKHTRLLGYVAFHALSQVGNYDSLAHKSASAIPDGHLQVQAGDDFGLYIDADNGVMRSVVGFSDTPRCTLWFADLPTLFQVLSGKQHIYDLIGRNRAGMHGFVPMVDYLSPVLSRTSTYLG